MPNHSSNHSSSHKKASAKQRTLPANLLSESNLPPPLIPEDYALGEFSHTQKIERIRYITQAPSEAGMREILRYVREGSDSDLRSHAVSLSASITHALVPKIFEAALNSHDLDLRANTIATLEGISQAARMLSSRPPLSSDEYKRVREHLVTLAIDPIHGIFSREALHFNTSLFHSSLRAMAALEEQLGDEAEAPAVRALMRHGCVEKESNLICLQILQMRLRQTDDTVLSLQSVETLAELLNDGLRDERIYVFASKVLNNTLNNHYFFGSRFGQQYYKAVRENALSALSTRHLYEGLEGQDCRIAASLYLLTHFNRDKEVRKALEEVVLDNNQLFSWMAQLSLNPNSINPINEAQATLQKPQSIEKLKAASLLLNWSFDERVDSLLVRAASDFIYPYACRLATDQEGYRQFSKMTRTLNAALWEEGYASARSRFLTNGLNQAAEKHLVYSMSVLKGHGDSALDLPPWIYERTDVLTTIISGLEAQAKEPSRFNVLAKNVLSKILRTGSVLYCLQIKQQ